MQIVARLIEDTENRCTRTRHGSIYRPQFIKPLLDGSNTRMFHKHSGLKIVNDLSAPRCKRLCQLVTQMLLRDSGYNMSIGFGGRDLDRGFHQYNMLAPQRKIAT